MGHIENKRWFIVGVLIVLFCLGWTLYSNSVARNLQMENLRLHGDLKADTATIAGLHETNVALKNNSWVVTINGKDIRELRQRLDTVERRITFLLNRKS